MLFAFYIKSAYLTTTFVVSPLTVTNTTPAGAAIVALSEATTSSATALPNTVAIVTVWPAAPCTVTVPLPAITLTADSASKPSLDVGVEARLITKISALA